MAHPLVGLVQLLLLGVFVCSVLYLNTYRPAHTHYRPFRVRWWVPTVAGVMLVLLLASLVNVPHYLQHTNPLVAGRHAEGRAKCQSLLSSGALHAERAVLFASEFFKDKSSAPLPTGGHTVSELLSPLLNLLLFNSGVTICAVPLLAHLLSLHLRSTGRDWLDTLRRESGVLLPVLNFISLVSAFTSPTFYLFIQPGRVDRCIYTSGHWFTFSVTLLTFSVIVAHLASYQHYCRSSGQLLALYVVWLAVYAMSALSVLKRTQEAFHDSTEAVDGIRQGLPAFAVYMVFFVALQYVTFLSTDTDTNHSPQLSAHSHTAPSTSLIADNDNSSQPPSSLPVTPIEVAAPSRPTATKQAAVLSDVPDAPPPPSPPPPPPPPTPPPMTASSTPAAPRLTSQVVGRPPAAVPHPRSALLAAIEGKKVALKPTPSRSSKSSQQLSGLAKILSDTRRVLEPDGEVEESDSGDSWE